ncbi:hypothetical protein AB0J52_00305 [Spirillospora sp. NPDC049652]
MPTLTRPLRPPQVLRRAAELIELNGLNKGEFGGDTGRALCTAAAIRTASGSVTHLPCPLSRQTEALFVAHLVLHELAEELETTLGTIAEWNDAPRRTAGQVVSVLRQAAGDLEPAKAALR